jgi:hypothetical protein
MNIKINNDKEHDILDNTSIGYIAPQKCSDIELFITEDISVNDCEKLDITEYLKSMSNLFKNAARACGCTDEEINNSSHSRFDT